MSDRSDSSAATCPNTPEWAEPNTPAVDPATGYCFHCSRVRGEWVKCEGQSDA